MKNLFLAIAFIFFGTVAFASNQQRFQQNDQTFLGKIALKCDNPSQEVKIQLSFDDHKSFTKFDAKQLANTLEDCTTSIEVSVTVSVGVVSATITLKAEGIPCDQVAAKIKSMVKEAKSAATAALK
jgi:hypothetical protein